MKNSFTIKDDFFGKYQKLILDGVIPYQRKVLADEIPGVEKSGAIANFRAAAGLEEGEFYGWVFQDSDLAKWLEAASYSLMLRPDPELEKDMDELIEIIGKAQQEDGYLDTYFILGNRDKRWTNLQEAHELYCAGHMIEAAVAHYEATGKTTLLSIMEKNVDCICNTFGKGKKRGFPGHPEIELALIKLYRATGKEKYLELAKYFIDERGTEPNLYAEEKEKRGWVVWNSDALDRAYTQNQAPVREQKDATGHAVRAVYLYTGMAGVAKETGDESLVRACETLWESITGKRMYISGGIGSCANGEAFTADYDLPNDMAYSESCASLGLMFFARKMLEIKKDSKYSDVMERALYNCVLSGMSLNGKNFFYVNPLEVNPEYDGKVTNYKHVLPVRPSWYGCACCPPNIARTLASLNRYVFSQEGDTVYSHLFIGGELELEGSAAKINVTTAYPYGNKVTYTFDGGTDISLAVRIPDWSENTSIRLNGREIKPEIKLGYAYIEGGFRSGDSIELELDFTPRKIYANVLLRENQGAVAVQRGPLVYCIEQKDNPLDLRTVRIKKNAEIKVLPREDILGGIVPLECEGVRLTSSKQLYSYDIRPKAEDITLKLIPYNVWCNRGENMMQVWTKEI